MIPKDFDPNKFVLTVFREEREASTDPMDRWGVVNRAFERIHKYMQQYFTSEDYSVTWDGMDTIAIKYSIVEKVNLQES